MQLQDQFNFMVAHLRQQGCASVPVDGMGCAYRGTDGRKCAVGCLIPDSTYTPGLEAKDAYQIAPLLNTLGLDSGLCYAMQNVHDHTPPSDWEREFRHVATQFSLVYTPPVV